MLGVSDQLRGRFRQRLDGTEVLTPAELDRIKATFQPEWHPLVDRCLCPSQLPESIFPPETTLGGLFRSVGQKLQDDHLSRSVEQATVLRIDTHHAVEFFVLKVLYGDHATGLGYESAGIRDCEDFCHIFIMMEKYLSCPRFSDSIRSNCASLVDHYEEWDGLFKYLPVINHLYFSPSNRPPTSSAAPARTDTDQRIHSITNSGPSTHTLDDPLRQGPGLWACVEAALNSGCQSGPIPADSWENAKQHVREIIQRTALSGTGKIDIPLNIESPDTYRDHVRIMNVALRLLRMLESSRKNFDGFGVRLSFGESLFSGIPEYQYEDPKPESDGQGSEITIGAIGIEGRGSNTVLKNPHCSGRLLSSRYIEDKPTLHIAWGLVKSSDTSSSAIVKRKQRLMDEIQSLRCPSYDLFTALLNANGLSLLPETVGVTNADDSIRALCSSPRWDRQRSNPASSTDQQLAGAGSRRLGSGEPNTAAPIDGSSSESAQRALTAEEVRRDMCQRRIARLTREDATSSGAAQASASLENTEQSRSPNGSRASNAPSRFAQLHSETEGFCNRIQSSLSTLTLSDTLQGELTNLIEQEYCQKQSDDSSAALDTVRSLLLNGRLESVIKAIAALPVTVDPAFQAIQEKLQMLHPKARRTLTEGLRQSNQKLRTLHDLLVGRIKNGVLSQPCPGAANQLVEIRTKINTISRILQEAHASPSISELESTLHDQMEILEQLKKLGSDIPRVSGSKETAGAGPSGSGVVAQAMPEEFMEARRAFVDRIGRTMFSGNSVRTLQAPALADQNERMDESEVQDSLSGDHMPRP